MDAWGVDDHERVTGIRFSPLRMFFGTAQGTEGN